MVSWLQPTMGFAPNTHTKHNCYSQKWNSQATWRREIDRYHHLKLSSTCYNVAWLTTKLKRMCRKKRRLFRRAKKSTNPIHKAAYKHIQNETYNALRRAHWSYVNGILAEGLEQCDMNYSMGSKLSLNIKTIKEYLHFESEVLRCSLQGL